MDPRPIHGGAATQAARGRPRRRPRGQDPPPLKPSAEPAGVWETREGGRGGEGELAAREEREE